VEQMITFQVHHPPHLHKDWQDSKRSLQQPYLLHWQLLTILLLQHLKLHILQNLLLPLQELLQPVSLSKIF
jgi:hypothetical protein